MSTSDGERGTGTGTGTRGGRREGAGRKSLPGLPEGVESVVIPIRATPEQKAKFHALGGADWFRRTLDRAKLPKGGMS